MFTGCLQNPLATYHAFLLPVQPSISCVYVFFVFLKMFGAICSDSCPTNIKSATKYGETLGTHPNQKSRFFQGLAKFWSRFKSRWWFQRFFIFTPTWGRFPIWLIFCNAVETTHQYSNDFKGFFLSPKLSLAPWFCQIWPAFGGVSGVSSVGWRCW